MWAVLVAHLRHPGYFALGRDVSWRDVLSFFSSVPIIRRLYVAASSVFCHVNSILLVSQNADRGVRAKVSIFAWAAAIDSRLRFESGLPKQSKASGDGGERIRRHRVSD